jgi:hypothetical protein
MKEKLQWFLLCIVVVALMIVMNSCGVIYEGKYGKYTLTPTGTVVIKPKYAQQPTSDKD